MCINGVVFSPKYDNGIPKIHFIIYLLLFIFAVTNDNVSSAAKNTYMEQYNNFINFIKQKE